MIVFATAVEKNAKQEKLETELRSIESSLLAFNVGSNDLEILHDVDQLDEQLVYKPDNNAPFENKVQGYGMEREDRVARV